MESLQATALTQEEHLASWTKSSTSMAWNLGPRMTAVESSQDKIEFEISSLRKDTLDIKSMMTKIYQVENVTKAKTNKPPSHTEEEHAAMEEEPTNVVLIKIVKPTKILTLEIQPITTIISTSQPEPSVPQREGKAIIQAHLDKEEKFKKAVEEAKQFKMTKTEVIKVIQEEAEKIGLNPKKIISAKAVPGQVASQSSGRKRKHMELEPEIKVHGLECNRSVPNGVSFVKNMVIKELEYGIFFTDVFHDQAFQRWNDIHKFRVDYLVSYLVRDSIVKNQENDIFGLKLRKLIDEHPDQE
nr:protein kinase superfamily protein [Tanacetum cinerariifolium]